MGTIPGMLAGKKIVDQLKGLLFLKAVSRSDGGVAGLARQRFKERFIQEQFRQLFGRRRLRRSLAGP